MASGMLTKQATALTAKFLNDVNDSGQGGNQVSVPAGVVQVSSSQNFVGDRMLVDDISALALSDTTVGTLYGGIYEYVQTLAGSTAAPARGTAAFIRAADLPPAFSPPLFQVTADAQPTTALPTLFAGVFINAITKGNYGWIQTQGVASLLFDSTITTAAVGNPVTLKVSPTVASTFDVGVASAATLLGAVQSGPATFVGIAIVLPVLSTITAVLLVRGLGRI
jgi:hypothetical protein